MVRGNITSIKDLLKKYTESIRAPQGAVIKVARDAIREVAGIDIPEKNISYNVGTKTIGISVAGPRKSEIMLRKGAILAYCKDVLNAKNAPTHIV